MRPEVQMRWVVDDAGKLTAQYVTVGETGSGRDRPTWKMQTTGARALAVAC